MIGNILRSVGSLRHPAVWWIMFASIVATIFIMLGFIWMADMLLTKYQFVSIPWVESLIENSGILAAVFLTWLLFPVLVPSIASLFEDKTAQIIESNEYGSLEKPHHYPWVKEISFLLQGLLYNAILMPVYVIPVVNVIAYYLLNSWLVGKGLFMLVATRYHTEEGAKELWEARGLRIKLYGAFLVLLSNIPVINLVAPLFGIILMVHYSRTLSVIK